MEIEKDALVRVIKAARITKNLAETVRQFSIEPTMNKLDQISGTLADALFIMSREKMGVMDDFHNSRTYSLLFRSKKSDKEVANIFIQMAEDNLPKQPKPQIITRDEFNAMLKRTGGYSTQTPEGEWK